MSRIVSKRISSQLHEELRKRCNKLGCSISDYIAKSLKFTIPGNSDFEDPDERSEH